MRLLIDGYNLLYVTDLFGEGVQAGTLEGSREALIAYLVAHLPDNLRRAATIVFDAAGAPPGLPDRYSRSGLQVRFARGYAEADVLIELKIEHHKAPKSLLLVSSDHRVQRAARSRGAKYVDSNVWFRQLRQRKSELGEPNIKVSGKAMSAEYWIREFRDHVGEIDLPTVDAIDIPPEANEAPPPPNANEGEDRLGEIFPADYLDELRDEFGDGI